MDRPYLSLLIERARSHVMTPAERREQRVSFIYGQLSEDNPLTKADIARMLGYDDEPTASAIPRRSVEMER